MQTNISTSSRIPIRTPFFYGWIIVFMSALGMFFSGSGQTYSISLFIDAYIQDFGWSRSLVSSMYSIATLVAGLLFFFVGRLIDRFGQRYMSVAIGVLLAVACLFNSFIVGPVMLFIGFFMIRLFGQGSMALIPQTLVPQWFVQYRGRALSFMAVGGTIGATVIPPFNAWIMQEWGWPMTWKVWAVLLCVVFVPLAFLLIRNKPEDVGLLPDHASPRPSERREETENDQSEDTSLDKEPVAEVHWTLAEAMRHRTFWLLLFCISIPAMINTGLIFHLVSILGENGIEATTAAFILSILAITAFCFTLIAGFLVERVPVHFVMAGMFVGFVLGMFVLLNVQSVPMAIVYGMIVGAVHGFEMIVVGIVFPNYFGRKHLGSIRGVVMTCMVIGSSFGPLPFGLAYDYFGQYTEIILIMMIFPVLGCIAALISPKPEKARHVSSQSERT